MKTTDPLTVIPGQSFKASNGREYRVPTNPRIESGAVKLYDAERKRDQWLSASAIEQGIVMGLLTESARTTLPGMLTKAYWNAALPEQLFSVLEGHDGGEVAALAFLVKRGYKVTR